MSSTTDPPPEPTSSSYWRSGAWLAASCLGVGAAVIAIRLLAWPMAEPVPTPDELFAEWDEPQAIVLGDAEQHPTDLTLPDLPPLPPIEFPADFPASPEIIDTNIATSGTATDAAPTWATYESVASPVEESPVWFAGTIEVLDDAATSPEAPLIDATGPTFLRR